MSILITGSAGFIGNYFAQFLNSLGYQITCTDNICNDSTDQQKNRVNLLNKLNIHYNNVDLSKAHEFIKLSSYDLIINLAAQTGLHLSRSHNSNYFNSNIIATKNLVEFANISNTTLIHASTSSVYGSNAIGSETSNLNPISIYGLSKMQSEQIVRSQCKKFTILRFFSVYGPGQRQDMAISKFIEAALTKTPVKLFSNGLHKRTPTYIEDIAHTLPQLIKFAGDNEIYNVGGTQTVRTIDIIKIINNLLKTEIQIIHSGHRSGDQLETKADIRKFISKFKFHPYTEITDGIFKQIKYKQEYNI